MTVSDDGKLECGCTVSGKIYLKVGKGVIVRQRVLDHVFGRRGNETSDWIDHYQIDHEHFVYFEVWYLPKNRIGPVEDVLIEVLKPKYNKNQTSGGFADESIWQWRPPDIMGSIGEVRVARTWREMRESERSPLKNIPGVYSFFVDPGMDFLALHGALMSWPDMREIIGEPPLPPAIRERVKRDRFLRKRFKSIFGNNRPLLVEET